MITDQQWYEVKIPIKDLTADNLSTDGSANLDLTKVDSFSIAPAWSSETELKGVHYQIDNVRFEN